MKWYILVLNCKRSVISFKNPPTHLALLLQAMQTLMKMSIAPEQQHLLIEGGVIASVPAFLEVHSCES